MYLHHVVILLSLSLVQTGCGLIFGGDQTVDTKSHDYSTLRLDKLDDTRWKMLESTNTPDSSDVAYEHAKTGAIISLNSICRGNNNSSLQELSRSLLMGLKKKNEPELREYKLSGSLALEATVDAETVDQKIVRIRTVVLRRERCTYDMMYVAPREHFQKELHVFNKFLKGFHIE